MIYFPTSTALFCHDCETFHRHNTLRHWKDLYDLNFNSGCFSQIDEKRKTKSFRQTSLLSKLTQTFESALIQFSIDSSDINFACFFYITFCLLSNDFSAIHPNMPTLPPFCALLLLRTEFKILVTLLCQCVAKITPPRILCLDMCLCFFWELVWWFDD